MASVVAASTILVATLLVGAGASPPDSHDHGTIGNKKISRRLTRQIAQSRIATAPYANDLAAAQADGYSMTITQMMPNMGHHFLNPSITEFDVTKPPILVYVRDGDSWQLVAFEWVFTEKPEKKPLEGARYGSFGAACHYEDGTFVFEEAESECEPESPESGAAFTFWHPDLVTLHLWAWYPNPRGVFNGTNPLVRPFNEG
jgi:hypothetical protein